MSYVVVGRMYVCKCIHRIRTIEKIVTGWMSSFLFPFRLATPSSESQQMYVHVYGDR
jgi:hypothetical protein